MIDTQINRSVPFLFLDNDMKINNHILESDEGTDYIGRSKLYGISVDKKKVALDIDSRKMYAFNINFYNNKEVLYGCNVEEEPPVLAGVPETLETSRRIDYIRASTPEHTAQTSRTSKLAFLEVSTVGSRIPDKLAHLESFIETERVQDKILHVEDYTRYSRHDVHTMECITTFTETQRLDSRVVDYIEHLNGYELIREVDSDIQEWSIFNRSSVKDLLIEVIAGGRRIQEIVPGLLVGEEYSNRVVTEFESYIDLIAEGHRSVLNEFATINTMSEPIRSEDEISVDLLELGEYTRELLLDAHFEDQVLGVLSALNTVVEEFDLAVKLSDIPTEVEPYHGFSKLSDYLVDTSEIEYSSYISDNEGFIVAPEQSTRNVTFNAEFTYHSLTSRIREYATDMQDVEYFKRDLYFLSSLNEFEESVKLSDYLTHHYDTEGGYRLSDFLTRQDETELGSRNVELDATEGFVEGGNRTVPISLTQISDMESGMTLKYTLPARIDLLEDFERDVTLHTHIDILEDYHRIDTIDALMVEQELLDSAGLSTIIEEFGLFVRNIELQTDVADFDYFDRTDVDAMITDDDIGIRVVEVLADIYLTELFEKDYTEIAFIETIEVSTRKTIKPTRVIRKSESSLKKRVLPSEVVKSDKASRARVTLDAEKLTGSHAGRIQKTGAQIVKSEQSTRSKITMDAHKLIQDAGIRNVINSAEIIKTVVGDRNSNLDADIIDKGGDGGLLEKDKKIWLIMGKMQPWSPWNWKKTRG